MYDPLRRRQLDTHAGFRTVWLNVRGWAALAGVSLAVDGLLLLTGLMPVLAGVAGAAITYGAARLVDYRRWLRSWMQLGCVIDAATGERIVAGLTARGIEAEYHEFTDDDGYVTRSIMVKNKDAVKARRALAGERP